MENSPVLPVTSTDTPEPLENLPVPSPNLVETSLARVTDTETSEETTLDEVINKHESVVSEEESTLVPVTSTRVAESVEQSNVPLLEDTKITEVVEHSVNAVNASDVTDNSRDRDNLIASPENQQEMRQETAEEEEVRSVLKGIAATGEFWYDWEKLRSMLSLHLKQILSEYPHAKMTIEEQKVSLGETLAELVKRLDDALHSYVDGPPFTLQRLSEIILDARTLYPNLSKLALALEKNLSVTSTLTVSTNPPTPSLLTTPNGPDKVTNDSNPNPELQSDTNPELQSDNVMENGAIPVAMAVDKDEIMTEVDADVSDVMTMDVETSEKALEPSPMATGDS